MKRFYVTMTWHDFPEGGSYGTVVEAEDHEQAAAMCRTEMAHFGSENGHQTEAEMLEYYNDDWELIDCFDLDEFIERHKR